jgi:hypothetical protein
MDKLWKYFLIGSLFWFIVDFTTAFSPDIGRWVSYMPVIWIFYFGAPLLFAYLIYRRKWSDKQIFVPMLIVLFVVEVIFTGNILLFTFPFMLVMIPIALCIYAFITYVPRWIVDNRLKENKKIMALLFSVWLLVAILSLITRLKGGK